MLASAVAAAAFPLFFKKSRREAACFSAGFMEGSLSEEGEESGGGLVVGRASEPFCL